MSCGPEGMSCGSAAWAAETAEAIDFSDRENVLVYVPLVSRPGRKMADLDGGRLEADMVTR